MNRIKKKLAFGCMRLPMNGDKVDEEQFCKMIDKFIDEGFNYFDTAHGYLDGKSELALKSCLTSRYPRKNYILTNKLTDTEKGGIVLFKNNISIHIVDDGFIKTIVGNAHVKLTWELIE